MKEGGREVKKAVKAIIKDMEEGLGLFTVNEFFHAMQNIFT